MDLLEKNPNLKEEFENKVYATADVYSKVSSTYDECYGA